jgi:hypothetical protein
MRTLDAPPIMKLRRIWRHQACRLPAVLILEAACHESGHGCPRGRLRRILAGGNVLRENTGKFVDFGRKKTRHPPCSKCKFNGLSADFPKCQNRENVSGYQGMKIE